MSEEIEEVEEFEEFEEVIDLCADCPDEPAGPRIIATMSEWAEQNAPPPVPIEQPAPGFKGLVLTRVEKYIGDFKDSWEIERLGIKPYEVVERGGNILTTVGATRMLDLLKGSGQAMTNTHTFMGVGDTGTAAVIGDTDLAAATGTTHRRWKALDATYPLVSSNVMTVKATYNTGEGEFAWLEWGIEIDDGTTSPATAALSTGTQKLFNRKVPAGGLGTKGAGVTWVLTVTITAT